MSYIYSEKDKHKLEEAVRLAEASQKYGIAYCTANDPAYPAELLRLNSIPPLLYYKGDISILNKCNSLAVIGSRKASAQGLDLSFHAGKIVAESGLNLVNGLALGCDAKAIQGALSANGKCVAIMPCGLEQIQPRSNQQLAEKILENGGCLISEYPIGTTLQKHYYIERDRLQSGISKGVLVIEAMEDSGTMHTAKFALQQAKRLAIYYHMLTKYSTGNQVLEKSANTQTIKDDSDLLTLIHTILQEPSYTQITFNFSE